MPKPDIKLVCFDLGGVLIRICADWSQACGLVGVPVPAALTDDSLLAKLKDLSDRHELDLCDAACFARQAAALTGLTAAQIEAMARAWLRGPYPGVTEMIERVKRAGLRTACLSNTNRLHWAAMTDPASPNYLPLFRLDHQFTSFLARCLKPHAGIFRYVERHTGLEPNQILFFDDSPSNVEGARACGWRCEAIDATDNPPAQILAHLTRYGLM